MAAMEKANNNTIGQCTSTGQCSNTHEFRMFGLFYLLERLNSQGHYVRAPINYDTLLYYASQEETLTSLPIQWLGLCIWDIEENFTIPDNFIELVVNCILDNPHKGYVIFPLYLWNNSVGHENYVLINCANKKMYRLEPNGYSKKSSDKFKALQLQVVLNMLMGDINNIISTKKKFNNLFDFEVLEEKNGPHTANPCGFCLTWTIWMVENFIESKCNYSDMMNEKYNSNDPLLPTRYNNLVYSWGLYMYNFLSTFLSHSQSKLFMKTSIKIQALYNKGENDGALTRSPELIHLSNVVLYYRFCYILCLVKKYYIETITSRGIDIKSLKDEQSKFYKGTGIKNIKGNKQNKKKRKSKKKRNKKVSVKKYKKKQIKRSKKYQLVRKRKKIKSIKFT